MGEQSTTTAAQAAWAMYSDYYAGATYMAELIRSGVARGFYGKDLSDRMVQKLIDLESELKSELGGK